MCEVVWLMFYIFFHVLQILSSFEENTKKLNTKFYYHQSVTSRLETFLNFLRVSVSVSKILVSKKSLGIGLENIWSRKKVSVLVSNLGLKKKS